MTLVGFKAKNHPQQTRKRGADDGVDERITPDEIFLPLYEAHKFTLDVAANAKCDLYFDREANGLSRSWDGEIVWCNPPWSQCAQWVEKAAKATALEACRKAVLLLPSNRTEQTWWQSFIEPFRDKPSHGHWWVSTKFLKGRQRFGWPAGRVVPKKGDRPPSGIVIVTFERSCNFPFQKKISDETRKTIWDLRAEYPRATLRELSKMLEMQGIYLAISSIHRIVKEKT